MSYATLEHRARMKCCVRLDIRRSAMSKSSMQWTVGLDLGDRKSVVCVVDTDGKVVEQGSVETREAPIKAFFARFAAPGRVRVAVETGTHSPWVSHLLLSCGFEVLVGNARKLRAIWDSVNKSDVRDAELLARIARFDVKLLSPIRHRGRDAHMDLAVIKARDALVRSRSDLINFVRGTVKASGARLPACSAEAFPNRAAEHVPQALRPALNPILATVASLTAEIRRYNVQIDTLGEQKYPETVSLRAVSGVGPVTALAFVLTLEDPGRFRKSRDVGPFVGLVPRRDQSGETDRQLRISKAGNGYLRRLLVGAANYIIGPFGPDCDLRRYGERIAARGGRIARAKAKVAVARKLAVLLHHLWSHPGEEYEPFRHRLRLVRQKVA